MITLRASSVPLALICPPSQCREGIRIDSDNQPSRAGSAAHEGIAQYAKTGAHVAASALADIHGVDDVDDLGMLLSFGRQAVDSLRDNFPQPIIESSFKIQLADDVELTGHPDLSSVFERTVATADYKSGWRTRDYYHQLLAYALITTEVYDRPEWSITLVWLRDRKTDTRSGTRVELIQFKDQLVAAARKADSTDYRAGEHCEFCPRSHNCPARQALVKQSLRDIAGIDADAIRLIPDLSEVYAGVKCIEKACEDFRTALKMEIEQNGPVPTPNGTQFEFMEVQKRELDPMLAWPVASAHLTPEELAPAVKLSLTKLLEAVSAKAGRGMKGKVKEELVNELDTAGAIERTTQKRLTEAKTTRA